MCLLCIVALHSSGYQLKHCITHDIQSHNADPANPHDPMPDPHDPILTLPTPMTPRQTCVSFEDACILLSCLAISCMLLLLLWDNNQHWLLAERSLIAYAALHLLVVYSFQQPSAENSPRASIYTVHPLLVVVPFIVFPWRCAIMLRPATCINPTHSTLCINHASIIQSSMSHKGRKRVQ